MTSKDSRRVGFHTLDVFTEHRFGGNPLAVIPDAATLTTTDMQRIATEFNLSETAFVLPPEQGGTHRVRIFTPAREMPFAGHPTIGAALLLSELAASGSRPMDQFVFEEAAGPVAVAVRRDGAPPFAELEAPQSVEVRRSPLDADELAAVLSLTPADIERNAPGPAAASCGVPFLFVRLVDIGALGRARLDLARWEATLSKAWAPNLYLYVLTDGSGGSQVRARMFGPAVGVAEDPATGGAVSALAGFLGELEPGQWSRQWTVLQGVEMGRPSTLLARVERRASGSTAVFVGGRAVRVSQGDLWL